jgi:hypothetical protein
MQKFLFFYLCYLDYTGQGSDFNSGCQKLAIKTLG